MYNDDNDDFVPKKYEYKMCAEGVHTVHPFVIYCPECYEEGAW